MDDKLGFLKMWRKNYKNFQTSEKNQVHSQTSKKNQVHSWGPIEWDFNPVEQSQKFSVIEKPKIDMASLSSFRVYCSTSEYFVFKSILPDFGKNVVEVNFSDPKNVYCLGLKIMYILSHLAGVSVKNLESSNVLARSLAHFYFFYHIQKMYNFRDIVKNFDTRPVQRKNWDLSGYKSHFVWFHKFEKYTPASIEKFQHEKVFSIRHRGKKVFYKTRIKLRPNLGKDFLRLLSPRENGITKIGQLLLQESCQAYMYCVLGAQARTRWKIVGDGAKSLETQKIFENLVHDVIFQNSLSKLIDDTRIAVADTRVRLDFCLTPGLIILPSNMIYIKDSPGYNNILKIATSAQKFGVNNVNYEIQKSAKNGETTTNKLPAQLDQKSTKFEQNFTHLSTADSTASSTASSTQSNASIFATSIIISLAIRLAVKFL